MAAPVVLVTDGAPRVAVLTDAPPATPVEFDGAPITLVASGAPGIVLVNDDGTAYSVDYTRITEDGLVRRTEDDHERVTEAAA